MEMGFPMEEAQIALYLNKNQVDPALQMLLETPEVIHRHLISPTTPTSHPAQTSFFTSSPPLTPTSSRPRHSSASYSPDPTTPRSGLHALPRMDDRPRSTSTSTSTSSSSSSSSRPFSLPKTFMQGKLAQWWSSTLQSPTHPSTVSPSTSSLGRTGSLPPKSRSFDPLPFPSKRSRWTPQWATYVMVVGTQRQQRFELTLLCHPDPFHLLKSLSHGVPFMKETTSEPEPTTKTKKNELKSSGHGTTVLPFKSNRFHPVRVFVHYFPTLSSYHAWTSSTSTSTSTTATATATTTASTQFHETSPSHSRERAWLLKQDKPKEKVEEEEEEDQDEDEEGDWLFQDVLWKELSTGSPLSSLSSSSSLFPSLKKETPLSHSSSSSTFLQPLPTYACLRHPLCWDHQVSLTPVIGPTQFHEVMMSMLLRYGEEGGVVPPHGHPHLPSTSFNLAWTVPLLDLQEVEKTLKILRACWTTYTRWNVPLQNKSKTKTKMKMKMKMKMKSKLHHELVVPLSTSSTLTSSSIPFQRNDFKNNHGLKKKTNPLPTTKTKVTKDEEKGTETEEVKNTPRLSRVVEEVHEIDDDDDDDEEEEEETTKKQKGTLRMNEEDVTTKGRVGPHVLVCLPSQFEKVQSLIQTVFKTSFQTQP
ncbi:hypothetical protein HMI56_003621 [Coelomomyces lativittatus]|nr:hypothetical protein HMI56_003621 [Coelomomyces lativittatus]